MVTNKLTPAKMDISVHLNDLIWQSILIATESILELCMLADPEVGVGHTRGETMNNSRRLCLC